MVERIEQALSAKDPAHAAIYKANADALRSKLEALAAELGRYLAPIASRPYIVFHDATQYLEQPLRPQRGGVDLGQPGGAGERQAPRPSCAARSTSWAPCACSPSRSSTRAWSRT